MQQRPALLWNKRILRAAVRDLLPADTVERPKVPFYVGDGVHHTYRVFVRMLAQDGDALLEEALTGPDASAYLDGDNARATLRQLERNPHSSHVELLLRLVNLGLLELAAAHPPAPLGRPAAGPPLPTVHAADWDRGRERIDLLTVGRSDLAADQVPTLREDVLVLDSPAPGHGSYVAVDGCLEYVIDPETDPDWLRFLHAVDGRRSLREIARQTGRDVEPIRRYIEDAVALGILTFDPPRGGVSPR